MKQEKQEKLVREKEPVILICNNPRKKKCFVRGYKCMRDQIITKPPVSDYVGKLAPLNSSSNNMKDFSEPRFQPLIHFLGKRKLVKLL